MKKFYSSIVLNKDELKESHSNRIELEYYKISRKERKNTGKKMNLYGIEIVKKEYFGKKKLREKENIYNLTNDESVINNLLQVLHKNKVTPIGLNDTIQEVL